MRSAVVISAIFGAVFCRPSAWDSPGGPPGGPGGPPGGPGGPGGPIGSPFEHMPPPPFLEGLSEQARQGFFSILKNMNDTMAKKKADLLTWGQANGVQSQVEEYEKNMANLITETKKNVSEIVNEMPAALLKFYEVIDNEDQSIQQVKVAMDDLIAGNPKLYHALLAVMKEFKPKGMGGPPCGPGGPGGPPGGSGGPGGPGGPSGRAGPCVPPGGRPPRHGEGSEDDDDKGD